MQDHQKQLKDMSVLDTVLTAMPDLQISAINGLENMLSVLLNSQNITGKTGKYRSKAVRCVYMPREPGPAHLLQVQQHALLLFWRCSGVYPEDRAPAGHFLLHLPASYLCN